MSSVKYASAEQEKLMKSPEKLASPLQSYVRIGDMLINRKTNEVAIAHKSRKNDDKIFFLNLHTFVLLKQEYKDSVDVYYGYLKALEDYTLRSKVLSCLDNSDDWDYIPFENIKNINFDIEMQ